MVELNVSMGIFISIRILITMLHEDDSFSPSNLPGRGCGNPTLPDAARSLRALSAPHQDLNSPSQASFKSFTMPLGARAACESINHTAMASAPRARRRQVPRARVVAPRRASSASSLAAAQRGKDRAPLASASESRDAQLRRRRCSVAGGYRRPVEYRRIHVLRFLKRAGARNVQKLSGNEWPRLVHCVGWIRGKLRHLHSPSCDPPGRLAHPLSRLLSLCMKLAHHSLIVARMSW